MLKLSGKNIFQNLFRRITFPKEELETQCTIFHTKFFSISI